MKEQNLTVFQVYEAKVELLQPSLSYFFLRKTYYRVTLQQDFPWYDRFCEPIGPTHAMSAVNTNTLVLQNWIVKFFDVQAQQYASIRIVHGPELKTL